MIIPADKTSNHYKVPKDTYQELSKRNIEKEYRLAPPNLIDAYNNADKSLVEELELKERLIQKMELQEAFLTLKDNKELFQNRADARLLNPTKSPIGKAAKIMLQKIAIRTFLFVLCP